MSRGGPISTKLLYERLRLPISRVLALVVLIGAATTESAYSVDSPLFEISLFFVGMILVSVASLGRLWCALYISGYKTGSLVKEGPYSLCRNPLYFFSFLGGIGIGLTTETLVYPVVIGVAFMIGYPFVVMNEERRLADIHGPEFDEYRKSTPRFIPNLSSFKEPDQYLVFPKIFRKQIFDALWFVWIVGILEFSEGLRESGVLPVWFTLP